MLNLQDDYYYFFFWRFLCAIKLDFLSNALHLFIKFVVVISEKYWFFFPKMQFKALVVIVQFKVRIYNVFQILYFKTLLHRVLKHNRIYLCHSFQFESATISFHYSLKIKINKVNRYLVTALRARSDIYAVGRTLGSLD